MPAQITGAGGINKVQAGAVSASKLDGAQAGAAPVFGARAFAAMTMVAAANPTINGSGNVASATYAGVGGIAIVFATPMASASYAAPCGCSQSGVYAFPSDKTANGFTIRFSNTATQAAVSPNAGQTFDFTVIG